MNTDLIYINTAHSAKVVHKKKETYKGTKLSNIERKRINADTINAKQAQKFEANKEVSKAQLRRQARQAKRNLKSFNKL